MAVSTGHVSISMARTHACAMMAGKARTVAKV